MPVMTGKDPKYKYEFRSRGGSGRAAVWEWSVYRAGEVEPLESGTVTGAQSKADAAGAAAVERWLLKDRAKRGR